MSRRAALPDAAELFRQTGSEPAASQMSTVAEEPQAAREPLQRHNSAGVATGSGGSGPISSRSRPAVDQSGRSTGRQRHDEKITVYVSATELVDLERARLALRATHGLAPDRGRIVREAIAILVADLDRNGENSAVVRRLRLS